jgi:hypothetical protein
MDLVPSSRDLAELEPNRECAWHAPAGADHLRRRTEAPVPPRQRAEQPELQLPPNPPLEEQHGSEAPPNRFEGSRPVREWPQGWML